jgi:hypothetical protein
MDYIIAMGFITWMITIFMLIGFSLVKIFEFDLRDENSKSNEKEKLMTEVFLQEYYDCNFAGKVNFIILHGARSLALILFRKKNRKGD